MPLQSMPSSFTNMNTRPKIFKPTTQRIFTKPPVSQARQMIYASNGPSTKDNVTYIKNGKGVDKPIKSPTPEIQRIKISDKAELKSKSKSQNDCMDNEGNEVSEQSERVISRNSLQMDCGDISEMEDNCSSEEDSLNIFNYEDIEKHINSLALKTSENEAKNCDKNLDKKQKFSFHLKRKSWRHELENNSNTLSDTVASRSKTVKSRTNRPVDESKNASNRTTIKRSKTPTNMKSASPKRNDIDKDNLQNTAKKIFNVTQQRSDIDNDQVVDLITLINPEVGDIVMQMQLEEKNKRKQEEKANESKEDLNSHLMKCTADELRMILLASKNKYDNLKGKAVRMRAQYILKSNRLKQMQRNMKVLIDRYKDFKKLHDDCENQKQNLRNQLIEAVKNSEESDQLVQEFNDTRVVYADKIKLLQDENQKLRSDVEELSDVNKRNETVDREIQENLDQKIELLENIKYEMKNKDEMIEQLQSELETSREEVNSLLNQSKKFHEENINVRALLVQKEVEATEFKLKAKMQEKTIKHLQLAYNLLLSDQDISSKSSAKCKIAGDHHSRHHTPRDSCRSNNQCVSNNTDEAAIQQSLYAEVSGLLNPRKNGHCSSSKHYGTEDKVEDPFSFFSGDRCMPLQSNSRPESRNGEISHNYKGFTGYGYGSPADSQDDLKGAANNSHGPKTIHQSPHTSKLDFDEHLASEYAKPGNENSTKTTNEQVDHSISHYLKTLFNAHDLKSRMDDIKTNDKEQSTVIVDLTENSQASSHRSINPNLSKSKRKHQPNQDADDTESNSQSQSNTPRITGFDRGSGLLKKTTRRTNSVPKHVTFVGTPERITDKGDVRSWCTSPTTSEAQNEGAHPLLCKRSTGRTVRNSCQNQSGQNDFGAMQRKLDSLTHLIQNQESGIQQLRNELASVIPVQKRSENEINDSTKEILSLLFDGRKPVPKLHET